MRRSLETGLALGGITLAVEALAVLPGRVAVGRHMGALGQSAWEIAIAGTLRDVSDVARPIGLVIGLVLVAALLVRARRPVRYLIPAYVVVALLLWFTSATAAEFKVQRGVDPTWFDVQIATQATTPGDTLLGFIACRRHYIPGVLGILAMTALLRFVKRRLPRWNLRHRGAVVGGFAAATLLGWGLALLPLDPHVRVFATVGDRHIVGEPFVNLFGGGFGRSQENVRLGMRTLIETARFPPERATGGERLLGLPHAEVGPGAVMDCTTHPFARSFPGADGVEPPRAGAIGHHELEPEAARVARLLDRLSGELYIDRTKPIDVWQLMLESFRGDDIHAIEPTAPRELAPVMNGLYEAAARGDAGVIAVRSMWQGGSRSSQGLSSYMCGLGTMPYGLSATRDFGAIPLRCLTDVLVDAKFETAFFYGGNPSFDEMDPFFRHHGLTSIMGRQQFPLDAPVGQEGVTDRAVYARAAAEIAKTAPEQARYTLIMSASNHIPYGRPEDTPPELDARAQALRDSAAFVGSPDDASRLRTFGYADFAIGELIEHLRSRSDRSILVLGADHATGDPFVWKNDARNMQAATARIPFAIVLPEGLIASSKNPDVVRATVRDLNQALDGHAWSQNDVPFFLLTLLSRSPGIRAIPAERRWHTLGGERTSPYFVSLKPEAKVIGIDSIADLYGENDAEESLLPSEKASFVSDPSEITTSSPSLTPVAAAMQTYLTGYVAKCGSDKKSARRAREPKRSDRVDNAMTERDDPAE
jgi:hypothetical protein